ncbi:MAG: class I SAM-dependent methyltransferase [Bacteroidetes bacterium]|nr:class I SAM-dependent methyltransferase [Bacteroidota bacterium]
MNAWFEEWFDSPFYSELYKNRNEAEAKQLISGIVNYVRFPENASILDVCCGKGRHCQVFSEMGFSTTGIDLSESSIDAAKQLKLKNSSFTIQDARDFNLNETFDCVVNLFTSFGYFETVQEHEQMLKCMAKHVKNDGVLVIDFFNVALVKESGPETRTDDSGLKSFTVTKRIEEHRVEKEIVIQHAGSEMKYRESVWLFNEEELRFMLSQADMEVVDVFGNYEMNAFDSRVSPRCILFAKHRS